MGVGFVDCYYPVDGVFVLFAVWQICEVLCCDVAMGYGGTVLFVSMLSFA